MAELDGMNLTQVAAELEIRHVLAQVAQLSDSGDIDAYLELFTEDAVWKMEDSPRRGFAGSTRNGIDDIAAGARERNAASPPDLTKMHFLGTMSIDVTNDTATGYTYFQFLSGTDDLKMRNAGTYHDTFRTVDGRWKLASRLITFG